MKKSNLSVGKTYLYLRLGIPPLTGLSESNNATRAGALAGVGLALDPEGNKSVLIQPSSLEKKYFKFYIFLIF